MRPRPPRLRAARALAAAGILWAGALSAQPSPAPPPPGNVAPELFGRIVSSVSYTCDGEVAGKEVESLISIAAGRPLTEDATGDTIKDLFGTRNFSNIVIEAEPADADSVAVIIHLWKAYRVRRVVFEEKTALTREDLRRAIPVSPGDPFNAGALEAGADVIERRLTADGYVTASVEPEAVFDPATFSVDITYRVSTGERARVAAPFFDGDVAPYSAELLARKGKLREGKPYREAAARAAAERIRKFLFSEDRYRANVELIAAEPTESLAMRPVYRISIGPAFQILATGLKEKAARRELAALAEGQGFDQDLLDVWVEERTRQLQRAGHYRAKVTATADLDADPVVVRLDVEPGPRYAVESIAITGNASVPEKTLRDLLFTKEKGLPLIAKGRLIQSDLDEDVSAILGYYQTHGWIDAKVGPASVTEGSRPELLNVGIHVVEGPRVVVAARRVEGAEHLTDSELDGLVTVREGEPLNPSAVRQDVASLTSWYWNNGWRDAAVQEHTTIAEDRTSAEVEYRVEEGMRTFFGKTIVRGNAVTDPDRIMRQVAWKEGEPFSEAKIADTQQNLARTGAFRTIQVQPQPADPDDQARNVDVELAEARRISLLYGFGYQNAAGATENRNDVFGVVGGTYRNLFGKMQSASLELQYAPLSQRGHVFASFTEPYLFGTGLPLTMVAFVSREPVQDIDIDRVGTYVESVRLFRKYARVGLRYEYQQIAPHNPQDLSTIELEKFPKSSLPIKQSAIGPSVFYDRRDDILNPQAGYYWTIAGKYAFPLLTADARYGKVSGQAAWFRKVPGGVLGASIRTGAIFPYDLAAEVPVPIAERFFAGGSATGRGFDTDLLGIPGVTVDYNTQATLHTEAGEGSCAALYPDLAAYDCNEGPRIIGGNGFLAWSLEYRVPIFGNLGASVFYDLAQVWEDPDDINFRIEGDTGLRQSIGAGLHFLTPIGPLRLEYAMPLQRRTIPFEVTTRLENGTVVVLDTGSVRESGRVLLSIGYPF